MMHYITVQASHVFLARCTQKHTGLWSGSEWNVAILSWF
jgi:hypothetical protein